MAINKKIPTEEWANFFVTFSNGNQGRNVTLEVFSPESGDSGQMRQGKLMAVDYAPCGKGNNIVVTTGVTEIDHTHTIQAPAEVWRAQHDDGEIAALEIIDEKGVRTVLGLGPR